MCPGGVAERRLPWWTRGLMAAGTPAPLLPDYTGGGLTAVLPALLGHHDMPAMPTEVADAQSVVLLIVDGLGWNQLQDRAGVAPTLAAMAGGAITSVAPTTTATALTSIATGCTPGEHGVVGYRTFIGGEVTNMLRWWGDVSGDRRRRLQPSEVQCVPPFLGQRVPYVTASELIGSAFSDAHLRGGEPHGYRSPSSLPVVVSDLIESGHRFVHAYYAGVDKIAHERGFGAFYDAELALADRMVRELLERLPSDCALVVTADHGQVEVGDSIVHPSTDLLSCVAEQSGEGRMRWFHARPGAERDVFAAAAEEFATTGWVLSREQVVADGWFGPSITDGVAARLGDVVVAAHAAVSYDDPDDGGPFDLVCRHGSLTPDEMLVPLIAARGER